AGKRCRRLDAHPATCQATRCRTGAAHLGSRRLAGSSLNHQGDGSGGGLGHSRARRGAGALVRDQRHQGTTPSSGRLRGRGRIVESFAELLDRLVLTPSRNGKLRLMIDYFASQPDPDRGWGLAGLTGSLDFPAVKPAMLRTIAVERLDPVLFAYSYDYVGDLAETVALVWPDAERRRNSTPSLDEVVGLLSSTSRSDAPATMARLLDDLSPSGRYAAIKLATGGLRVGVSARLAKQALADFGNVSVSEIEELWHGLTPPYTELFAWLEGSGPKPVNAALAPFRPVMLSTAVAENDYALINPDDYAAEWKWDGIRVQVVSDKGVRRLYSRTG